MAKKKEEREEVMSPEGTKCGQRSFDAGGSLTQCTTGLSQWQKFAVLFKFSSGSINIYSLQKTKQNKNKGQVQNGIEFTRQMSACVKVSGSAIIMGGDPRTP